MFISQYRPFDNNKRVKIYPFVGLGRSVSNTFS